LWCRSGDHSRSHDISRNVSKNEISFGDRSCLCWWRITHRFYHSLVRSCLGPRAAQEPWSSFRNGLVLEIGYKAFPQCVELSRLHPNYLLTDSYRTPSAG
jgi:hypothetical protein